MHPAAFAALSGQAICNEEVKRSANTRAEVGTKEKLWRQSATIRHRGSVSLAITTRNRA
jgi:hypothetical protein